MSMIVFLLINIFIYQTIEANDLIGIWKSEKIIYVDQQPVNVKDGEQIVWEFNQKGKCINHSHHSEVNYTVKRDQLDMDGYSVTIEKLTSEKLIIRENKQFFMRRIYFTRIHDLE